jgi:type I restriction-modification system DNA methylase subunit
MRISWRPTGGRSGDIAIYDHESNPTTRKLAKINLAIYSIDEQIAHGFTVNIDRHPNHKGASPALVFGEQP